jgi:hypothetical protein
MRRRSLEVGDQGAVEAVEDGEVGLVGMALALARAAAEHLLEQDARLHRAQEDDELQVGDVHAGGQQVHRDDDAGVLAVAELADALERAVHAAGDLLHEGVAAAEGVAADLDELVGVGDVGQVVGREDEGLGEAAVFAPRARRQWSLEGLDDLAVRVGAVTLRSISVGSNWRSSSRRSSCFGAGVAVDAPTCSPSFRKMPFMRTSERTLTTS